ncbi:autotransporter assembly complex protein TamA [Thermomonas carbonis]|uniref:Translocation and assembly module subunit TamA n=1 Tax=Thermomonas carbonis TaxID=1463158 RepID=A0A7G9SSU8_9GAMM|nr:autotransporter assembly complex family protein [Thermomonas carbonis]QNN70923.1 outer membrane protein assembly factor [Thermomonas carbonis]GHC03389.1 outer membrane protein assembly factor [Thermomonas carbonis]
MTPSPTRLLFALACCLATAPAMAAKVTKVEVKGLADAAMQDNVRSALSLSDELDKDISARRLNYLLRQAEAETREALEPFGYYSPTIVIRRSDRDRPVGAGNANRDAANADASDIATSPAVSADAPASTATDTATDTPSTTSVVDDNDDDRDATTTPRNPARNGNGRNNGRTLDVVIEIDLGQPVRVRRQQVGVEGAAQGDKTVTEAVAAFLPRQGEVLDHQRYEASKRTIAASLLRHGYFDAAFAAHRVEVTRADFAADIDLRWTSGERFLLGAASFKQEPKAVIRDSLLAKLVNWDEGEPYDEAKVERLRRSLIALDYFGLVEVSPKPEDAQDKTVPIEVNLTPAPRSIYTMGLSYGTLSGAGISGGVERRYINSRGHKVLAQVDYADKRKFATLQYRVPAFAWLDGWYTVSLQAADELTDYVNSRRLELVGSRSGQFNDHLTLVASLHVLRERWAYNIADDGGGALAPISVRYGSFVFPQLRAEYVDVDDRLDPRRGAGGTLTLRGGSGGSDGKATFLQLHASAQWFHGFDADSKLIVRGEAGHTFTDELLDLPTSLRFFAGGDRSVRGYGWHEIGPKVETDNGFYYTGAANVVTASVEYERYFKGPWGAAVFIDSGSAFDGRKPDMHTGVGIGLRWRSPVGPVRIDIARGLKSPDSPFTLHLNIGASL